MSPRLAPWRALAAQVVAAAAVLAWLRPLPGPATAALAAAGALAGVALFAALAGRAPVTGPMRAGLVAVLVVGASAEEILWRLGLCGGLARVAPMPAALAVSSVAFALAHLRPQGLRGFTCHLVTGTTFGSLFAVTGSVVAAAGAHAAYNVLVASAARRARGPAPASVGAEMVRRAVSETRAPPARLTGVRKRFGVTLALDGVDLQLRPGEIVCLLGPNGAGKSTAVSILLGLRRADAGTARLFGLDPRAAAARRRLGATPQEVVFPSTLRVREVATLVAAHYPSPEPTDPLLKRFGLEPLARRQVGGLSVGERRRLAVALAFAGRPDLAALDEPTAGLDVEARHVVWRTTREFAAGGGAVLFTTHDLDEAEALASRVVLLVRGRVVAEGSVEAIRARVGLTRIVVPAQPLPPLPTLVRRDDAGGRTTLLVRDAGAALRALARADVDLAGIEVRPVSLEEVFLSLLEEHAW